MGKLSLGIMSMFRGEFTEARSDLEAVLRLYAPSQHETFVREAGVDPHLNARMFLSIIKLCLGYPDQASALSKDTIDEAKSSKHRPSHTTSLAVRTRLLALMRDNILFSQTAEQLFTLALEQSFSFWCAQGTLYRGWGRIMGGDLEGGIPLLHEGTTAYQSTGAEVWMPFHLALEAQAANLAGQTEEATGTLARALQAGRKRQENWFEAELVRRYAELVRDRDSDGAENLL